MDKKEIRFIDSQYNELFRIHDGGQITIHYPDGHKENRVCKYIDDYHTYINDVCFHICQFAEVMENNNQTYSPAQKFELEHISQKEFEFVFAPKDKNTERGCIGYLRADFGTGKEFHSNWFEETDKLKNDDFKKEIDEVINYFRLDSATPVLKSRADMHNTCYILKPTVYSGDSEIKAFKVITDKHTYYMKCKPRFGEYDLYCYAYNSEQLCKYQDLAFVNEHYEKIDKDKFFKTENGLREVYYNPDANAGGQIVELHVDFDDIRKVAREYKKPEYFFSHLGAISKVYLIDVGTKDFRGTAGRHMKRKGDFEGCTLKTMNDIRKYVGLEKVKPPKEPER